MDRNDRASTRETAPRHGATNTAAGECAPSRVRLVLPPSHGNASLLPLPLPESLWPTASLLPGVESSRPRPAMFVPRVTARALIVAAVLALTFIG